MNKSNRRTHVTSAFAFCHDPPPRCDMESATFRKWHLIGKFTAGYLKETWENFPKIRSNI